MEGWSGEMYNDIVMRNQKYFEPQQDSISMEPYATEEKFFPY